MSVDLNRVTLTGRLTRDPQAPTPNVCAFSLAVNGRASDAQKQWHDTVEFVDVVVYGKAAAACTANLSKGRRVAIDGRLRLEQWQDKNQQKRSALKVVAQSVIFLDPRSATQNDEQEGSDDAPQF